MTETDAGRTDYYYVKGQPVPLRREPSVYAVRFRAGDRSDSPTLSGAARRLLRDDSRHIGFIPNYGLQLYRSSEGAPRLWADLPTRRDDPADVIGALETEATVELAALAYRRTPESDELMFVTRLFAAQFRPEVSRTQIDQLNSRHGVRVVETLPYAENGLLLEAPQAEGPTGTVATANLYYESGLTLFATPDFVRQVHFKQPARVAAEAAAARADERSDYLEQQWHLRTAKVTDAWDEGTGDPSIVVAILDDGVDVTHPEFAGKVVEQYDFAGRVADGTPKGPNDNHGTACAGVAVASGVRAYGAAPGCSLLAVRTPEFLGVADEAAMFTWVAAHGADVISCSWGPADGTGATDPLPDNVRAAIRHCVTSGRQGKGIPVLWAAGNGDESISLDGYAANPDVIAVAASTSRETRAWYSDYGPEVWVCAPSSGSASAGEQRIFTTDRRGNQGYNKGLSSLGDAAGDYASNFGGTSSATPLVAGIVALMLSKRPSLTQQQVKDILKSNADRIGDAASYDAGGHSPQYGFGRVNAARAVAQAGDGTTPTTPSAGPSISGPVSARRSDGPPTFDIGLGSNRYYAVEVATRWQLFDDANHGGERAADNFYGSWQDTALLSSPSYTLPAAVWERLRAGDRLYYRVHTAADQTTWQNYEVTTPDTEAASAPFIQITADGGQAGGAGTVVYPLATFAVVDNPQDDIDYSDPVAGGLIPVIEVRDRLAEHLSTNFTAGELAARRLDNRGEKAPYARISPELVERLQELRERLGAPITITSGYRYPALNDDVDGANSSQHMAGRAADISSGAATPLELARLALEVFDCEMGIGLGRNIIHVDVRGELASWTYTGAAMTEPEFDAWVRETCAELGKGRSRRQEIDERLRPAITGPETHLVDAGPPTFTIQTGANRWYAVEVATRWDQFAGDRERTPESFHASWTQGLLDAGQAASTTYTLPASAWEALRQAPRLYYRVLTTSANGGDWPDLVASTPDERSADAPWIELVAELTARDAPEERAILTPAMTRRRDEARWRGADTGSS
jgi:subtilisin family serine protease